MVNDMHLILVGSKHCHFSTTATQMNQTPGWSVGRTDTFGMRNNTQQVSTMYTFTHKLKYTLDCYSSKPV